MNRALAVMLFTVLASLGEARGADTYGPPAPEYQNGRAIWPSQLPGTSVTGDSAVRLENMNPLSMLSGVGDVLISRTASSSGEGGGRGSSSSPQRGGLSTALNIMVVLTVVSLAPSIVLMCTCFVRILIVLGFLRQALGTSSIPPPQVVTALALFATLLVMTPTIQRINTEAIGPFRAGAIQDHDALWNAAKQPLRDFMFDQIEASGNWTSVYTILDYRGIDTSDPAALTRASVDMVTLVPAFILSELKIAFLMGFKVFLPFLVIDMVVSTMLISMGMMMLPPVLISLPFKILLFILVDGWALVVGSLLRSFRHLPADVSAHSMALPAMHDTIAWISGAADVMFSSAMVGVLG